MVEGMEPIEEEPLGDARGPGLPGREGAWRERVVNERRLRDAEGLAHLDPAPADDVHCLGSGGEPVRPLVERVVFGRPFRQSVARVDRGLQAGLEGAKRLAELRLERGDAVPAQHEFRGVVQELSKSLPRGQRSLRLPDRQHGEAVLGDGERVLPS